MEKTYRIRRMRRDELDWALQRAAAEGWNPGRFDADAFWAADPGGYWVGLMENEPVACLSVVRYGGHFGFVGLYIVEKSLRHHGYGLALWKQALAECGGRVLGLDAVVEQQATYARDGFVFAHRNLRYGGTVTGGSPQEDADEAKPEDFEAIVAYDRTFFPAERTSFLARWLDPTRHRVKLARRGGVITGYGVLRPCGAGYKIGPLFADDPETAERLFASLHTGLPAGETVYLDLPADNREALAMAERFGMAPVFETGRMYRGTPPQLPLGRIYGITTFELG